jgi:hypothetical protein
VRYRRPRYERGRERLREVHGDRSLAMVATGDERLVHAEDDLVGDEG